MTTTWFLKVEVTAGPSITATGVLAREQDATTWVPSIVLEPGSPPTESKVTIPQSAGLLFVNASSYTEDDSHQLKVKLNSGDEMSLTGPLVLFGSEINKKLGGGQPITKLTLTSTLTKTVTVDVLTAHRAVA